MRRSRLSTNWAHKFGPHAFQVQCFASAALANMSHTYCQCPGCSGCTAHAGDGCFWCAGVRDKAAKALSPAEELERRVTDLQRQLAEALAALAQLSH